MKATGIVRRIDDLGRVVIPKEIRRTMRIREGDPLEIYTEKDGEVIFKKYSPMVELTDFASQICESIHKTTGAVAIICDRDSIIAGAGISKKELIDRRISSQLEKVMENRAVYTAKATADLPLCENDEKLFVSIAAPIIASGDVLGCVLFIVQAGESAHGETECKLAQTVSNFLGRQMEE